MPSCSKAKNPHGVEILFEEETHKYSSIINENEIIYTSGTTFINNFFPKFDPTGEILIKTAKKRGVLPSILKKEWDDKRINSCIFGTKIHETCEDVFLNQKIRNKPKNDRERFSMKVAQKAAEKVLEKADILGVEKIVFDEDLKIAGTMDGLIKSKKDGKIWIIDWKTNEKITTENTYNKFGFSPIEHIPDINYEHYSLQLNLYEYILKKVGYIDKNEDIGKCIIHITDIGSKSYVMEDRQKEISDMIDLYKEKRMKLCY